MLRCCRCLLLLLLSAFPAAADLIYLKNGDRLSGTIRYLDGIKLVLKTDYAPSIAINWSHVSELHMRREMIVKLQDGSRFQGNLAIEQSGAQILLDGKEVEGLTQLTDIHQMFAPPTRKFSSSWSGSVEMNGKVESGSSDTEEFKGKLDLNYSSGRNRHRLEFSTEQERKNSARTKDRLQAGYQFDHFLDQHWYSSSGYQYNRNKFKSLERRHALAQSIGYSFFDNPVERFYIETGLSYTDESFESGTEIRDLGLRWALGYRRQSPLEWVSFYHEQLVLMPRFRGENTSFYTDTGLEFDLPGNTFLKLSHEWDYDRRPDEGDERRESEVRFGGGYRW